jgi:hypothetical protein
VFPGPNGLAPRIGLFLPIQSAGARPSACSYPGLVGVLLCSCWLAPWGLKKDADSRAGPVLELPPAPQNQGFHG